MCAPRKLLPIISSWFSSSNWGLSVGSNCGDYKQNGGNNCNSPANIGTALHGVQKASTLKSLSTALQTGLKFANSLHH
ncbi:MAG: hypothetical protein CM15mV145_380 [uncultured marine virus]|nr:MAG: hypothetical protein CM15mV145_380 [uncultured marine virus]